MISLERVLCECEHCSLLTCIGAAGYHIHQGILMCPAGHPLLPRAIHKVMETPPSSVVGSGLGAFMTFGGQMWDMLKFQAGDELMAGKNVTSGWGSVWFMRERIKPEGAIDIRGQLIQIDGQLACMKDDDFPVVAIRCEGWTGVAETRRVCVKLMPLQR